MRMSDAEKSRRWRERNPERAKEIARNHYHRHKDELRIKQKEAARRRRAADPEGEREKQRLWRQANPHKSRAHQVKIKYGLTMEQVEALFEKQGRCCAICKSTDRGSVRSWPIDHDHNTGRVRGILCAACNIVIHKNRDTEEFFRRVIDYINNPPYSGG